MFLTPEALLSNTSRTQCIARIKELPEFIKDTKHMKNSAVLVPLCVVNSEVCLLFTLRSLKLKRHSGQVSFPGGKSDYNETCYETALRETEEEIGISSKNVDIWTKMCLMGVTNILITTVVGELKDFDVNKLRANENEVAEIFTVSMKVFCDQENHAYYKHNNIATPVFICGKHKVWGVTGMITHLFLQCFLPQDLYRPDFLRKEYKIEELMPSKL